MKANTFHVFAITLEPKSAEDAERLGRGLAQLTSEDPQLQVRTDQAMGSVVLRCISEQQLDASVDRLGRDFHVQASVSLPQVITRTTVARTVDGEFKYAKNVQGRGHYGHVKLRLHPVVPGTGHVIERFFPAGAIPDQFLAANDTPSLERGVTVCAPRCAKLAKPRSARTLSFLKRFRPGDDASRRLHPVALGFGESARGRCAIVHEHVPELLQVL